MKNYSTIKQKKSSIFNVKFITGRYLDTCTFPASIEVILDSDITTQLEGFLSTKGNWIFEVS